MTWHSDLRHWFRGLGGLKGVLGLADRQGRTIPRLTYAGPSEPLDAVPEMAGGAASWNGGATASLRIEQPSADRSATAAPMLRLGRESIFAAFNAAVPVADRHGLAGRQDELVRLIEGVIKQRKHGVIFGNRGSGKTSLARVFGDLADEGGCIALYGSTDTEADLDDLFRPFLTELAQFETPSTETALPDRIEDAQQLAQLLYLVAPRRCLLILDEFDRIASDRVRHQVAALLKLLSDMHAPVHVILVGIAGDVDELLAAHPSLLRHIVAQPVLPIDQRELVALLQLCARQAGFTMADDAAETIAVAAMGSPFHARLFGMHAALVTDRGARHHIAAADVNRGFVRALDEWRDLAPKLHAIFTAALDAPAPQRRVIALTGVLAAQSATVTIKRVTEAASDLFGQQDQGRDLAHHAFAALSPALRDLGGGAAQFDDTLAPQFLVLMAKQSPRAAPLLHMSAAHAAALNALEGITDNVR